MISRPGMELRGNVVGFGDPLRPPIKKKGRFDNATDNPSTRLFYREEWVDNRKSIYRVTEREPLGFVPSSSFYLPPAPPHPAFKPEYYKRREQEEPNWFFLSLVSVCGQWRASYFHGE